MKYWFEAKLEKSDGNKKCTSCGILSTAPNRIFVEHKLVSGNISDHNYPSFVPTGKIQCYDCGTSNFI